MITLTVKNLRLSFGSTEILKGVSLSVEQGQIICLLGPSGCGKSTLLRAIAGLELPSHGVIALNNTVLSDPQAKLAVPANDRQLGFVFQSYALWPHMTVAENVSYGLRVRQMADADIRQRVGEALSQVGLAGLNERYPHELSGGQQQRVALARALVYNPPVLLLDEPLSNLDAKLRLEARAWLREVIERLGISAICVTHDQDEAMALGDKIVLMKDGEVVQTGSTDDVFFRPNSAFVAEFFGVSNRLSGIIQNDSDSNSVDVALASGSVLSQFSKAVGSSECEVDVVFRATAVSVSDQRSDHSIEAELVSSRFFGAYWEYHFDTGDDQVRTFGNVDLNPGSYWLTPAVEQCWAFERNAGRNSKATERQ